MKKGEKRKNQIVQDISIYILENGVQTATLRNLAEAASTSDRMLMHYFRDKEELLTVALNSITDEFITILDSARTEQKNFVDLLPYLREMMKHPGIKPYIKLCLELAAIAAKKEEPFYSVGNQMCATFLDCITREIKVDSEEERDELSALTLVMIEGFVFLDALDYHEQIDKSIKGIGRLIKG
ncbi:hypothetical protein CHN50_10320 [Priestia aryabhattai]|uniref:TetR/AcrR family transcriptional regulator n=1 Tax=Bacillaceae TaxID=186817 RepID=UPI000BA01E74|nr:MULTISPECIES: TetR/AcrR family transcriptional regulator [Bacillaceae]MBY6023589.1 TetR/AcrR family transcriptional regulator [Nitratireductor sp. DP7N14-4]OZT12813.1 hypothetical protein CHN50_10320 [Priestia aryabhattai]USY55601.1 TetR/AcrR family transcriptional regulator [Bacillus sp. 1780r2a1]MDT2048320.1 TetR/AcrR family transcriptional regulator [Priestia flexa]TDB53726.1 TetR/AcrR family transcriptional regulator [Bacillus sp. CBEL-1]